MPVGWRKRLSAEPIIPADGDALGICLHDLVLTSLPLQASSPEKSCALSCTHLASYCIYSSALLSSVTKRVVDIAQQNSITLAFLYFWPNSENKFICLMPLFVVNADFKFLIFELAACSSQRHNLIQIWLSATTGTFPH